ncbi:MAG: DUF502 domain-containing protein [Proteobacteria bacterium]|nr:DUF502 domain-containing protein [Pseudomonadota bacterium]
MSKFLKTTVLGGVIFLIPLAFFGVVISKALAWIHKLAAPLLAQIPVETIGGTVAVHLLPIVILLMLCFFAGLVAKTSAASSLVNVLETKVLRNFPPYALLKAKTGSVLNPGDTEGLTPVLVRFDDSWQIAFDVEKLEEGMRLVFLPGAPDPWSGSVCAVTEDRITPLDTSVQSASAILKRLGKGASEIIRIPSES